jgi:glycosyltransferase involved in cell wall biosynthesis
MSRTTISVIMLTFNREALVSRAIESVLAQTFRDFEFIIVDNGSADRGGVIADEYAAADTRIRVIHRARGNIGSGRNTGLDAARGDWIAFIDDDDWCEPDFLAFLHALVTENDADVAICGAADRAFDEKRIMDAEEALVELMWRKRYSMAFPTKLFSQALAEKIRFPEADKYDDISQMPHLFGFARRVAYHGLPKYTFYRHAGNNSAWTTAHERLNAGTLAEYLRVYRERTKWLLKQFPDSAATWRYFEWSFMISMVEKITRLKLTDCHAPRDTMRAELREHREEFMNCTCILDFEREWMDKYLVENSESVL